MELEATRDESSIPQLLANTRALSAQLVQHEWFASTSTNGRETEKRRRSNMETEVQVAKTERRAQRKRTKEKKEKNRGGEGAEIDSQVWKKCLFLPSFSKPQTLSFYQTIIITLGSNSKLSQLFSLYNSACQQFKE